MNYSNISASLVAFEFTLRLSCKTLTNFEMIHSLTLELCLNILILAVAANPNAKMLMVAGLQFLKIFHEDISF